MQMWMAANAVEVVSPRSTERIRPAKVVTVAPGRIESRKRLRAAR